ncbi:MAG: cation:proton antiporter [Clostridia bacterium]|nr:sodium:proton antiporter [Clostridiales bacterium]MBR2970635.1 cation:proton antiporter [Clostridia bacterium]
MLLHSWDATLVCLAIALIAGLVLSRIVKLIKLPAVTGYLIAGVLVGPYCLGALGSLAGVNGLGFVSSDAVSSFSIICEVALGFIAFSIGTEFRLEEIKHIGKKAVVIAIVQALMATLFVDVALILMHLAMPDKLPIAAAIVLGAVATATAPAATLMVVRQYKARGPVTDMLLPVVALDDAIGLVVFSISFGIAKTISSGDLDVISVILNPLLEVIISVGVGSLLGYLFNLIEKCFKSNSKRLALAITFVLFAVAVSSVEIEIGKVTIGFSSLLVCMMLGTLFCNCCKEYEEIMEKTDKWTSPLLILFFVISGAELELSVFTDWMIVLVGIVYVIIRAAGKYVGANVSAGLMKCDPMIKKYLGITLFPQAGVALGMSLTVIADGTLGASGELVRNITLFAVLIYELVGPLLTKMSLTKAGEIVPKDVYAAQQASADDDDE